MTKDADAQLNTSITPYLMFGGRCEEALAFYTQVLGAKVEMMMRFKDNPDSMPEGILAPGYEDKVMHMSFVIRGTRIMASDGCGEKQSFSGFSLSLSMPSDAEARRVFALLAEGGFVSMPLTKTFWSPCFGMLVDRFGVNWMMIVPPEFA